MISKLYKILVVTMLSLSLLFGSGEIRKAEAKGHHKKIGFFTRIKRAIKRKIKRAIKKTRRAIVNAGCAVQNKVMDGAVNAKSAITGKKPRYVWVKGHYSKGRRHHTKGHFRRVNRKHKPKPPTTTTTTTTATPGPKPNPTPTPVPTKPAGGGAPLPTIDEGLPKK